MASHSFTRCSQLPKLLNPKDQKRPQISSTFGRLPDFNSGVLAMASAPSVCDTVPQGPCSLERGQRHLERGNGADISGLLCGMRRVSSLREIKSETQEGEEANKQVRGRQPEKANVTSQAAH